MKRNDQLAKYDKIYSRRKVQKKNEEETTSSTDRYNHNK
jgi:hypothetical protein